MNEPESHEGCANSPVRLKILGTKTPYIRLRDKSQALTAEVPPDFSVLSHNKVTGWSVNFPIYSTCQPSQVCVNTCYALTGPITWTNSLKKQKVNEYLCKEAPIDFAEAVVTECKNHSKRDPAFFLRWNGVGDLFDEAIESLDHIAEQLPALPIWVVTRIPKYAQSLLLRNRPNVFVHFSLDKQSMQRRTALLTMLDGVKPTNLFFSYQCDKNEDYTFQDVASVVFLDRYKPQTKLPDDEAICPLNRFDNIEGMCGWCRRCFDGTATQHSTNFHQSIPNRKHLHA